MHVFDQWDADDEAAQHDRDTYRAWLEALESARIRGDAEAETMLRAQIDTAPFCRCPSCEAREDKRDKCMECHGDGFVSDCA